jgi:hypothetical protein
VRYGSGLVDIAYSVDGIPIRLTVERWFHIVESHDDLAGRYDDVLLTVEDPDLVLRGYRDSLVAVRGFGRKRYLAVIYRELSAEDGFVITAYFTSRVDRRKAIWKRN